jgi:ankyrin repeat protein
MDIAIKKLRELELKEPLLKGRKAADLNRQLLIAAEYGQTSIVNNLLKSDSEIDINSVNKDGDSALILAAKHGHIDIVKALLKAPEIKVNIQGKSKNTALIRAAYNNHITIVIALLKMPGINLNLVGTQGETALFRAAEIGCLPIAEALIQARAKVNVATIQEGYTALHQAVYYHHMDVAHVLIKAGADLHSRTRQNEDILQWVHFSSSTSQSTYFFILSHMKYQTVVDISRKSTRFDVFYNHIPVMANKCIKEVLDIQKEIFKNLLTFRRVKMLPAKDLTRIFSDIYPDWYNYRLESDIKLLLKKIAALEPRLLPVPVSNSVSVLMPRPKVVVFRTNSTEKITDQLQNISLSQKTPSEVPRVEEMIEIKKNKR